MIPIRQQITVIRCHAFNFMCPLERPGPGRAPVSVSGGRAPAARPPPRPRHPADYSHRDPEHFTNGDLRNKTLIFNMDAIAIFKSVLADGRNEL
ncbi:hypothetical protein EVAR_41102_1 [Eumeta japonica]|uniref:Uncharacterized protein n=1 Tax=Eumeta variegata TaxID=151549 RepID=A0A4C1XC34_EUMVA|nr:hypothetical protein EVAR_41102_1 [Eumeta japonica]